MDDSDSKHWLRLQHSVDIGAATVRKLLNNYPDLASALDAGSASLQASGINKKAIKSLLKEPDQAGIDRDLAWREKPGNHIISLTSERYPVRLRSISNAPLLLYVSGDIDVLHTPQLAVVGSRNPSTLGRQTAEQFSAHLAATGITITSGMALGIDAASHLGALKAGGFTIAVAATGLDRVYPAQHRELAEKICAEGAIVSEFPVGTTAQSAFFPRRNRVISGLSIGTLVVEAAVRSGSLTTAQHAIEQGREVFAIPGSIHNPMARGCHRLIKQGAKLIEVADEILEELEPHLDFSRREFLTNTAHTNPVVQQAVAPPPELDSNYEKLFECIEFEPLAIDTLVELSGLRAAEVASMLLMLELNGRVVRLEGNKYARR